MKRGLLPLAIFLVLVGFLAIGLKLNPREVPSPLVGKPAPAFTLPQLAQPGQSLSRQDLKGQVWLLNVWASWCVACRAEHPLLVELAKQGIVPIYGLNYKDKREDALIWLKRLGDPYVVSLSDTEGLVGIDYGGVIRHKQIGPVTPEALRDTILPLVEKLRKEDA
jgi:cytochrome c biogenesis protein CcmG/thiol:disulfide interchange protein DsbE